jgi:hypothetical protein
VIQARYVFNPLHDLINLKIAHVDFVVDKVAAGEDIYWST